MKILKIHVSGFKLLDDEFELDFFNKAKVSASDKEDEITELLENLYIPTTTVFAGKNASGKSSVLSLLEFINELLYFGRIKFNPLYFRNDTIYLTLYFAMENYIYKYTGVLGKPSKSVLETTPYCRFSSETLYYKKYFKSYGKKILEADFVESQAYTSNVSDTSILYKLTSNRYFMLNANDWINKSAMADIFNLFESLNIKDDLLIEITNLFDESITQFKYDTKTNTYTIDLDGLGSKEYSETDVDSLLSEGTKKGVTMFALVIAMLKFGGSLIIDEIENSFHKNLVENVIMIFNDKRINKNKANLIFSTHYVEILDIFRRRDNIFIMSKNNYITCSNLHEDYEARTDLSKSKQFNNNTFQTLINYERLMNLKKELINEISDTSGG